MKRILIAAPYSTLPSDKLVNRFAHLAKICAERGHETTLATGQFSHRTKSYHQDSIEEDNANPRISLIKNRSYSSHIGMRRILSLRDFKKNFELEFANLSHFDVVYSAYPPIGHNLAIASRRNKSGGKFILDVQDVWPESFSSVLPFLSRVPVKLIPFSGSANKVYSSADAIVAVSQTYLERAVKVNPRAKTLMAYLGSEFKIADTIPVEAPAVRLFYIGALSHSYDIATIIDAVHGLTIDGRKIEFNVFGSGPDLLRLQDRPHSGTFFHGFLPYKEMEDRLRNQHVAVNAIRPGAPQSVTNKLCDYLALGCPILNSQDGTEVRSLLASVPHQNYRGGDVFSAKVAIERLIEDPGLLRPWRGNATFSREIISNKIVDFIESV